MIYSELDIPSRTRQQQLLIKLDQLNPVDADEYRVTAALNSWLDMYYEAADHMTLDDMHYSEYAARFSEDIGPVELVLCTPQWWSLLVSTASGVPKFISGNNAPFGTWEPVGLRRTSLSS